ncbi:MAG TPA: heavy metal translocating P-type ATPase [Chitinivibrionales bacterium]|nr:heavy metal translocating P-type ATPase [Chitinivibrionales bacterium]
MPPFGKDPVCGMSETPAWTRSFVYKGVTYRFCSKGCLVKFKADPEKYLNPADLATAAAPEGAYYVCPMDPEVRLSKAGACPKCGMALEPEIVSLDEKENPELAEMTRRFWTSLALTAPLVAVAMLHMTPRIVPHGGAGAVQWLELALALPVVVWAGWPLFVRAVNSFVNKSPNMFTLIGLGVFTAFVYSFVATLAPGVFPPSFRGAHGIVAVYYEAAAAIITLVLLGQVLEIRARQRTSDAIRALLERAPKTACRIGPDGSERDVAIVAIAEGDRLRIRPGEKVPADGIVLVGSSAIDESLVTGEPMPVEKNKGDKVIGSTINTTGSLVIKATAVGGHTLLSRIVGLVASAQRSRPPIQKLADRAAFFFVPVVVAVAAVTFAAWAVWGPAPSLAYALVNAVAVLIIACPCALGLATPMSIMVATGRAAKAGILFRDASALEVLGKVDTLVIDKTGTLTLGKPAVTAVVAAPGFSEREVLSMAATLERGSEHPLAAAVVRAAQARGISFIEPQAFMAKPGRGVTGTVAGRRVAVGSRAFLEGMSIFSADAPSAFPSEEARGGIYVAINNRAAGVIRIKDPIKETTPQAMGDLRRQGLRVVMLTGDNASNAWTVASKLGINEVIAGVLPDRKAEVIKRLQNQGRVVAMAGDGINDAPALAQAQVGIAMGTGTDVAMESAGITLVKGDLAGIARAMKLSHATMRNIKQNLLFAFVYNSIGVPVAAGVLYPLFGVLLSPIIAAAAMSFSSVSVITNALRLRKVKL